MEIRGVLFAIETENATQTRSLRVGAICRNIIYQSVPAVSERIPDFGVFILVTTDTLGNVPRS